MAAFSRAAANPHVDGVEFDVRRARDGTLVLLHDPPQGGETAATLEEALAALRSSGLELLVEIKENGVANDVIAAIERHGLAERSIVFGFPDVAASLPWAGGRPVRLGIIIHLPWQARRLIARYKPDVVLTGWDQRSWTRAAFRIWWSIFELRSLSRRSGAPLVAGIVRRPTDYHWLERQGVDIATADLDTPNMARLVGAGEGDQHPDRKQA